MKYLVFIFLISCAQGKITLKENELHPFKEFSQKTLVNKKMKSIQIDSVVDQRENKDYIGEALTGVNYKKTPVSLKQTTTDFVNNYFVEAFERRGLQTSKIDGVKLSIHINELWVQEIIQKYQPEKVGCKANFSLFTQLGSSSWKGSYWVDIVSPGDMGDATEKIAPTLSSCLNEIVEKIVNDKQFIANFL
jgi:uncharacterized lipoprotein YajG